MEVFAIVNECYATILRIEISSSSSPVRRCTSILMENAASSSLDCDGVGWGLTLPWRSMSIRWLDIDGSFIDTLRLIASCPVCCNPERWRLVFRLALGDVICWILLTIWFILSLSDTKSATQNLPPKEPHVAHKKYRLQHWRPHVTLLIGFC